MRMESPLHLQCLFLLLTALCGSMGSNDPCDVDNHKTFPKNNFGSRNEICEPRTPPECDYYLQGSWYAVDNSTLLNGCPVTGDCGVAYPTWMDGYFPRVKDGMVNHTACIKMNGDCCKMNVTISIKNCTSFFVYYLQPLPACPMAYCFESNLPCNPPTTTTGTTQGSKASLISGKHYMSTTDSQNDGQVTSIRYKSTKNTQKYGLETNASQNESDVLLISICAGSISLMLVCIVFVAVWMWKTGRLQFKRPPSALAKHQTTVAPHFTNSTYTDQLPPPYSEK